MKTTIAVLFLVLLASGINAQNTPRCAVCGVTEEVPPSWFSGNNLPVVGDDSFWVWSNTEFYVLDLLVNDISNSDYAPAIESVQPTTTLGGTILIVDVIQGSLRYFPPRRVASTNDTLVVDTVEYCITNGYATDCGIISFYFYPAMIWYVDNDLQSCATESPVDALTHGTSWAPWGCLHYASAYNISLGTDEDDYIRVRGVTPYLDNIILADGQHLIGTAQAFVVSVVSAPSLVQYPDGDYLLEPQLLFYPTIQHIEPHGIQLANRNEVAGLIVDGSSCIAGCGCVAVHGYSIYAPATFDFMQITTDGTAFGLVSPSGTWNFPGTVVVDDTFFSVADIAGSSGPLTFNFNFGHVYLGVPAYSIVRVHNTVSTSVSWQPNPWHAAYVSRAFELVNLTSIVFNAPISHLANYLYTCLPTLPCLIPSTSSVLYVQDINTGTINVARNPAVYLGCGSSIPTNQFLEVTGRGSTLSINLLHNYVSGPTCNWTYFANIHDFDGQQTTTITDPVRSDIDPVQAIWYLINANGTSISDFYPYIPSTASLQSASVLRFDPTPYGNNDNSINFISGFTAYVAGTQSLIDISNLYNSDVVLGNGFETYSATASLYTVIEFANSLSSTILLGSPSRTSWMYAENPAYVENMYGSTSCLINHSLTSASPNLNASNVQTTAFRYDSNTDSQILFDDIGTGTFFVSGPSTTSTFGFNFNLNTNLDFTSTGLDFEFTRFGTSISTTSTAAGNSVLFASSLVTLTNPLDVGVFFRSSPLFDLTFDQLTVSCIACYPIRSPAGSLDNTVVIIQSLVATSVKSAIFVDGAFNVPGSFLLHDGAITTSSGSDISIVFTSTGAPVTLAPSAGDTLSINSAFAGISITGGTSNLEMGTLGSATLTTINNGIDTATLGFTHIFNTNVTNPSYLGAANVAVGSIRVTKTSTTGTTISFCTVDSIDVHYNIHANTSASSIFRNNTLIVPAPAKTGDIGMRIYQDCFIDSYFSLDANVCGNVFSSAPPANLHFYASGCPAFPGPISSDTTIPTTYFTENPNILTVLADPGLAGVIVAVATGAAC